MGRQVDLLVERLFEDDTRTTLNVGIFPGSNRDATAEQIAGEINKAHSQLEVGNFREIH